MSKTKFINILLDILEKGYDILYWTGRIALGAIAGGLGVALMLKFMLFILPFLN